MVYETPSIRVLGTLSEMTQSLLPSLRAAGGTMAAISAPVVSPGAQGVQGQSDSSSPAPAAAQGTAPVAGTGDSQSPVATPIASTPTDTGGDSSGTLPATANGDSGGTTPVSTTATNGTGAGTSGDAGELPMTGFAAGAVAAAGAVLTGTGVALRRALRDDR